MADLGPIRYTQPRPFTPDTSGLERGIEALSGFGQEIISNDILGSFSEDAEQAVQSVVDETVAGDARAAQFAEQALQSAEQGDFLRETQLLRQAIQNAPTAGARTRASLKLQEALQNAALRNPKMRDALIREAQAFQNTSSELTQLGLRDSTLGQGGAAMQRVNERVEQLKDIAYKSIESGGLGMTSAFGTEAFAREFRARNGMLQLANESNLQLEVIKSQEGVAAHELERRWQAASKDQLNLFYASMTDSTSALSRLALIRRNHRLSGGSDAELVAEERDFKESQVPVLRKRIEQAIAKYRNDFSDTWATLAGTQQYTAARQRMEDEIEGLRQVSSLLEDSAEEAWNVLKATQTQRTATVLDEYPLVRNLSATREALGVDTLDFALKHDKVYQGATTQRAISMGLIEVINDALPIGPYVDIVTGNVDPQAGANNQNRALDSKLANNPQPLGGRTEGPEDNLRMAAAHAEIAFARLNNDEPLQGITAVKTLQLLNGVSRAALMYGSAAPGDEAIVNEMRTGLGADRFVELVNKAKAESPNAVTAFGESLIDYSGNQHNSYDSWFDWSEDINATYNFEPVLNGKPLAYFGRVYTDHLESDGRIEVRANENEIRAQYREAFSGPDDNSVSEGAKRSVIRAQEDRAVNEIYAKLREVEDQANLYTRNIAHREWVRRGGEGNPIYDRAFTDPQRGMYNVLGVVEANAQPK